MADLSLGPLRIANPDDASPDLTPRPLPARRSPDVITPMSNSLGAEDYLSLQRSQDRSPVSPLEYPLQNSVQAGSVPPAQSYNTIPRKEPRRDQRQSQNIPYTYQQQQSAQFPQYPTMMPQNQVSHSHSSRPVSSFYTQTPTIDYMGPTKIQDGTYRIRSDSSRSAGLPQRSTSRGSNAALEAGVESRDSIHQDRQYKTSQYTNSGLVPPRKASRRVPLGGTPTNNTPLSTTPMSNNTPLSSSPYAVDGAPISQSSEEWKERGAAVSAQKDVDANGQNVTRFVKKGVKDFNFGQTLGEGSYSTVLAATDRQTLKEYAIKVLDKRHIIKEKKVKYVNIERDTLNRLTDHPGVVRLYYTFQDERSLYFVLDLCTGGELLGVLKRMTTFDEDCTRFYCAEILDTIEYMHGRGVIHRDLKPENILLDEQMHVKITDFGTAKILEESKSQNGDTFAPDTPRTDRANSFVGTAEYVSPELLTDKSACKASDLWAFGCMVYQLLAGRPPFKAGNEYQTFQKIVALDYEFPRGFPAIARDLVERLLVLDPQRRLPIEHIKNHEFFTGIRWGREMWSQKAPRLRSYHPPSTDSRLDPYNSESYPPDITPSHSTAPTHLPTANNTARPQTRVIAELPPPSQLDIEWSPVLFKSNERILKLGNLCVISSSHPHSPRNGDGGNKFAKFFGGGNNSKKRQRLVMVTSSARILMAAAGGEEKKIKSEINLLETGCLFSSSTDMKGVTRLVVDTKDKHYLFEDIKPTSNDPMATAVSTQEWLDNLERSRELAYSQGLSAGHSYNNGEDSYNVSAMSSSSNTMSRSLDMNMSQEMLQQQNFGTRQTLHKHHSGGDAESLKTRKRFSKRQSKSGLAAVF